MYGSLSNGSLSCNSDSFSSVCPPSGASLSVSLQGVSCSSNGNIISIFAPYFGFSGTLSPTINNLVHLQDFELYQNNIRGTIPSELYQLTLLSKLDVSLNAIEGSISSFIGQLSRLENLNLGFNSLSGSIPIEVSKLSGLTSLLLEYNHLKGAIPSNISQLRKLVWIDISYNALSGIIPSAIGSLENLQFLILTYNSFSGMVPDSICNLQNLESFQLCASADRRLFSTNASTPTSMTVSPSPMINGSTLNLNFIAWVINVHISVAPDAGCPLITFLPPCIIDAPNPPLINLHYKSIGRLGTATSTPSITPTLMPSTSTPSKPTLYPSGYPTSVPTTAQALYSQVVLAVQQVVARYSFTILYDLLLRLFLGSPQRIFMMSFEQPFLKLSPNIWASPFVDLSS